MTDSTVVMFLEHFLSLRYHSAIPKESSISIRIKFPALCAIPLLILMLSIAPCYSQSAFISRLGIFDDSSPSGEPTFDASIDTLQGVCSTGDTAEEPEPFRDTYVGITIKNSASSTLRLQRLSYVLPRANGRKTYTSPPLGFIGALEVAPNSEKTIYAPIISQESGEKKLPRSRISVGKIIGFRTVTFRVAATVANRPTTLSGAITLSFGNFDRCE
jgi:hypothetical protein